MRILQDVHIDDHCATGMLDENDVRAQGAHGSSSRTIGPIRLDVDCYSHYTVYGVRQPHRTAPAVARFLARLQAKLQTESKQQLNVIASEASDSVSRG